MPLYQEGKVALSSGLLDWPSTGLTARLLNNTYVPSINHAIGDLVGQLSGGNYADLTTVAGRVVARDDGNSRIDANASALIYPSLGAAAGTPRYVVLFITASNTLVAYQALQDNANPVNPAPAPVGNNYEVRWNGVDGVGTVFRIA